MKFGPPESPKHVPARVGVVGQQDREVPDVPVVDLDQLRVRDHPHADGLILPRGRVREALLEPVADGREGQVLLAALRLQPVEHVLRREGAVGRPGDRRVERDDTEIVEIERVRVVLRMPVRRPTDVAVAGVSVDRRVGAAGAARRDGDVVGIVVDRTRREPDLDVRRRRLGAVTGGQEDRRRHQGAAAPPERVPIGALGDHEPDVGMPIAVQLAVGDREGRRRQDADRHDCGECRECSLHACPSRPWPPPTWRGPGFLTR